MTQMSPTVQLYHQNIMDVILAKMGNKTIEYWWFLGPHILQEY